MNFLTWHFGYLQAMSKSTYYTYIWKILTLTSGNETHAPMGIILALQPSIYTCFNLNWFFMYMYSIYKERNRNESWAITCWLIYYWFVDLHFANFLTWHFGHLRAISKSTYCTYIWKFLILTLGNWTYAPTGMILALQPSIYTLFNLNWFFHVYVLYVWREKREWTPGHNLLTTILLIYECILHKLPYLRFWLFMGYK